MLPDPAERLCLADDVLSALHKTSPASEAILRGSLAEGRADAYSDIDVLWEVDDPDFLACVGQLREILTQVHPIASLRSDPDLQNSAKHRLFFIRFADVPLFWRLDLEVFTRSAGRDPTYDLDNPKARGIDWSPKESALANAVAAVKAKLRGKQDDAYGLLDRAYQRVGLERCDGDVHHLVVDLAEKIARIDATQLRYASEVQALAIELLT